MVVDGVAASDRVVDLARAVRSALGDHTVATEPGGEGLRIDGRWCGPATVLREAGLRHGSTVELDREHRDRPPSAEPDRRCVVGWRWNAGPDAGRTIWLPDGAAVVGRSPSADVCVADPAVHLNHLRLSVGADATVDVTSLAPGRPFLVSKWADAAPADRGGRGALVAGARLTLGTSSAELLAPTGTDHPARTTPPAPDWRRAQVRKLRSPRAAEQAPIPLARIEPMPIAAGWGGAVPLAVTVGASVLVGVLTRQPILLVMGLVAAAGSAATWIHQLVRSRRARRQTHLANEAERRRVAGEIERARHRERVRRAGLDTLATAVARAHEVASTIWERRPADADAWDVAVGYGDVEWSPPREASASPPDEDSMTADPVLCAHGTLHDVPITLSLGPARIVGVAGPRTTALAAVRAWLVQLAVTTGPADWTIALLAHGRAECDEWSWIDWLPHLATMGRAGRARLEAAAAAEVDALVAHWWPASRTLHRLLVLDSPDLVSSRLSPGRRLIETADSPAVIVIADQPSSLPPFCTDVMEVTSTASFRWWKRRDSSGLPQRGRIAGAAEGTAADVARRLAGLSDPERAAVDTMPSEVGLVELLAAHCRATVGDIIAAWDAAGRDPALVGLLGAAANGAVDVDLARDGPHALIAGTTGAGKSELLRTLVVSLAACCPPEHVTFVLIDYKGGTAFDRCAALPHVGGVVTDLDGRLAARVLRSLDAELRRREALLRSAQTSDLTEYRRTADEALPRLVIVVDEFAALASDLPDFLTSLVSVAQRGRGLGLHLVLATQRPAGVVSDDIRANTNIRIALRLQDRADAIDVVGDDLPAMFGRREPGRAVLRLGTGDLLPFQAASTALAPATPAPRLTVTPADRHHPPRHPPPSAAPSCDWSYLPALVAMITAAYSTSGRQSPRPIWLPPLPARLQPSSLQVGVAGVVDDPDQQRQSELRWRPDDGHLVVVGAVGSGVTSTLAALVTSVTAAHCPSAVHIYAIAANPSILDRLARLPHVGSVVHLADRDRIERLLAALAAELDVRRAPAAFDDASRRRPPTVLVIDGIGALRAALGDDPALGVHDLDRLERIIAEGPDAGLVVLAGNPEFASIPLSLLSRSRRWVMRLDDRADAALAGLAPSLALDGQAPPGRLVLAGSGLEAQVGDWSGPATLEPAIDDLVAQHRDADEATWARPIGVLPDSVSIDELPEPAAHAGITSLPLGVDARSIEPAVLVLFPGDHVLVLGSPRSGRSAALQLLARQWQRAHPDGLVVVTGAARSTLPGRLDPADAWCRIEDQINGPLLVVVDDADLVDDPAGRFGRLCGPSACGLNLCGPTEREVTIVAAGRPDALRAAYGHWLHGVRRSGAGLLLGPLDEFDADLFGVARVPRSRWRGGVGKGLLFADGRIVPIKLATHPTDPPIKLATHPTEPPTRPTGPPTNLSTASPADRPTEHTVHMPDSTPLPVSGTIRV
jgi:S-DNA-T family DNA segregation ATPase FtsK/SpoIIIE